MAEKDTLPYNRPDMPEQEYIRAPNNERFVQDPEHPGEYGMTRDGALEIPINSHSAQRILASRRATAKRMDAIYDKVMAIPDDRIVIVDGPYTRRALSAPKEAGTDKNEGQAK